MQNASVESQKGFSVQASIIDAPGGVPLPSANSTGDELFRMGLLYSTGQGGAPLDYISAHMLFNLAAMRGSVEAQVYRRELSREMDHEEVAEAQRAARRWLGEDRI
jgi:TPR repeat protein